MDKQEQEALLKKALLTIGEVCAIFGVSRSHVGRLIADKKLDAINITTSDSKQPYYRVKSESVRKLLHQEEEKEPSLR